MEMRSMGLNGQTVVGELRQAKACIEKWILQFENGVPCVDEPAPDEELMKFLQEFIGEMQFTADKCESLAQRIFERD